MEGKKLSKEEDLRLEKQLKLMNKPSVKTIKTIHGDVYNCVDFYQQPAFDHPLLKNHTFDFKIPHSSYPSKKRDEFEDDSNLFDPSKIWLNGEGCPVGTVPIKKITKNDLFRAKLASEMYASKLNPQSVETPGLHLAVLRTKADPNKKYYGARMFTIAEEVKLQNSQSSYSRLKMKNDADYIEAGWMVNPLVYKDNKTRISCKIPLDLVFSPTETKARPAVKFMINRDAPGNWNLYIGTGEALVGFWDYRIFEAGLNNFATYIDWGGQVYGPPSLPSAPMGRGVKVSGNEATDSFDYQIEYALETSYCIADNVEAFSDIPAYDAWDAGIRKGWIGHQFFYGGPGKKLSREEDLGLDKQLKLMNKPAAKTIKIRPPSHPKRRRSYEDNSTIFDPNKIWLNGKGCPVGTVPMKKITKKDLLRAKLASEIYASKFNPQSGETPGLHFATMRIKADPKINYYGGAMYTTLHKVQVQNDQSSYSRMKVKNNADYIEAGWMAGQSVCFNTYCPGFVHVSAEIPIDSVFTVTIPGLQIVSVKFMIDWDGTVGNWYLYVGNNNTVVGFWNYRIFKAGLNNFASYIDWGGQVYGPPDVPSAPMGAGKEVIGKMTHDAACWEVEYANKTHYMIAENVEQYADIGRYSVLDGGIQKKALKQVPCLILYGAADSDYHASPKKEAA
ncbi:unnamed protein product [Dovyalis caffra]|uniref:Neprosin PEP catalytic domain-containing protein n=1 Tax=Dovyalis caffra TaxID=77055 RepID=A0AAV1R6Q2_9ROSI|nr:unnamed protein product [Dovyalis caffra]